MKIYCIDEKCPNKTKGYAICTALMDVKECPKRISEAKEHSHEENSQSDCNIQVQ